MPMRSAATFETVSSKRLGARPVASSVVLLVAAFLLLTMGGAIIAAPFTIPLLWKISRGTTRWRARLAAVLAALTTVEVVWAATYVSVGDAKPCVWLVPLTCGVACAVVFVRANSAPTRIGHDSINENSRERGSNGSV